MSKIIRFIGYVLFSYSCALVAMDNQEQNHYEVLGVQRTANAAEIKRAYHRLAMQWHPNKNIGNEKQATTMFQRINEANEVLSDSEKRRNYDYKLRFSQTNSSSFRTQQPQNDFVNRARRAAQARREREARDRATRRRNNLNSAHCSECYSGRDSHINMPSCGHRVCMNCAQQRFVRNNHMNCPQQGRYGAGQECRDNISVEQINQIRQQIRQQQEAQAQRERATRRQANLNSRNCSACRSRDNHINMPNCGHRICINCAHGRFVRNNHMNCPQQGRYGAGQECRDNISVEQINQIRQQVRQQQEAQRQREEQERRNQQARAQRERAERRQNNLNSWYCSACYSSRDNHINMPNCGHRVCINCAQQRFVRNNHMNCPHNENLYNFADAECRENMSAAELAELQQNIRSQQAIIDEEERVINNRRSARFIMGAAATAGVVTLTWYLYKKWQERKIKKVAEEELKKQSIRKARN